MGGVSLNGGWEVCEREWLYNEVDGMKQEVDFWDGVDSCRSERFVIFREEDEGGQDR